MLYTHKIKKKFSAAAGEYETRADFQAEVAGELLSFMGRTLPLSGLSPNADSRPLCRVLDTGCGTGRLMRDLYDDGEKKAVFFGLDMALPMLIEAKKSRRGMGGLVNALCETLPFRHRAFDHVVSNLAYQWVRDIKGAFAEVERVLLPGGSFSFSTLGRATLNELRICLETADSGRRRFSLAQFAGLDEIKEALKAAGLQLVDVKEKRQLRPYKNPMHLLKTIKHTGASARGEVPENTLSRGTFLKKALNVYEKKFSRPDGTVRATYEVILITARKAK
jgi:malonyl-ACP O-methyltransferase BioC